MSRAAEMAAAWWSERLAQGDRLAFRGALEPRIDADLAEHGHCWLKVDYDPQDIMLEAVRAIGIQCSGCMWSAKGILPMKTSLHVFPDRLEPKEGYGTWTETIPVPQ